jgi:Trypsin-co-occurring domain 2
MRCFADGREAAGGRYFYTTELVITPRPGITAMIEAIAVMLFNEVVERILCERRSPFGLRKIRNCDRPALWRVLYQAGPARDPGRWIMASSTRLGRETPVTEIDLVEAVRALRSELERAMESAAGQRVKFEAMDIRMDFQVGVKRTAEGKGGLKFWVLELGGGGSYGKETVQTVSLSLKPILHDGAVVQIARAETEDPLG